MWKSKNILPNNGWVKEEITSEIRKYFEIDENEDTVHNFFWDAVKALLRGKFIAVNAYIGKEGRYQIKNLNCNLT